MPGDLGYLPTGTLVAKGRDNQETKINLSSPQKIGSGAFCVAYSYLLKRSGQKDIRVALKACDDKAEFKGREKDVLMKLQHPNIIEMLYHFEANDATYLVLELMDSEDLFDVSKRTFNAPQGGMGIYAELYSFQMFRGVAYCHSMNVIHRDLKPENLFVRHAEGLLKLGDFGISVRSGPGRHNSFKAYVGTRDFRAPEMLLGATEYCPKVDVWSGLVVLSELILNRPMFGDCGSSEQLLTRIAQYLGEPTEADYLAMNASTKFADVQKTRRSLENYFVNGPPGHDYVHLYQLLRSGLIYNPHVRLAAWDVCAHPYYDKLKNSDLRLPSGNRIPNVFDFDENEKRTMSPSARHKFLIVQE